MPSPYPLRPPRHINISLWTNKSERSDCFDSQKFQRPHRSSLLRRQVLTPRRLSEEALRGSLHHFEIKRAPTYKALSYEWGEKSSEQILVHIGEDGSISIRSILRDFLNTLRRFGFDHNTWFWVDQICIDQTSCTERNHQVQLMSEIYSKANEVLAWVGDALPDSRNQKLDVKLLLRFTHCSYWKRLWIMQEIMLASRITVCGLIGMVDWKQMRSWVWPEGGDGEVRRVLEMSDSRSL